VVSGRRDGDSNTTFCWKQTGYHSYNINSAGILFDLMRGYGIISKWILLTKLNSGVWYITNLLFKSHLLCQIWFIEIRQTGNRNYVQNKSNAFCREMKHVEPQGSVLGLILLLIVWEWFSIKCSRCKGSFICR
jgi:hypothetical protein